LAKVEPYAPDVVRDMKTLGENANSLGCYGITAYHCWNYIAPEHFDEDATWTVSYRVFRVGTDKLVSEGLEEGF
jgi:hypothetical protein